MRNGLIAFNARKFRFVALGLIASLLLACAGAKTTDGDRHTLRSFEGPYDRIWQATVTAVQGKQNVPLKIVNPNAGFLASDWVMEERTLHDQKSNTYKKLQSRYRLNVSLRRLPLEQKAANIERVTITVNKQLELKDGDRWRAYPSDQETEAAILASIGRNLGQH